MYVCLWVSLGVYICVSGCVSGCVSRCVCVSLVCVFYLFFYFFRQHGKLFSPFSSLLPRNAYQVCLYDINTRDGKIGGASCHMCVEGGEGGARGKEYRSRAREREGNSRFFTCRSFGAE